MMVTVVDASGHALGRLASIVAKRLLQGEEIALVNAEQAVLTGRRAQILQDYRERRARGAQKRKGPFYPRRPDNLVRRTVRGMLPYQQPKGRVAFKRLRVYVGMPSDLKAQTAERLPEASRITTARVVTLAEVARNLGSEWGG